MIRIRYHTFCKLAGVDHLDAPPGLPSNVDSLDVWPLLSGASLVSPRKETPLAIEGHPDPAPAPLNCRLYLASQLTVIPPTRLLVGIRSTQVNEFGNFSIDNQTALIVGEFKAIFGLKLKSNFWQGPDFPNATYLIHSSSLFIILATHLRVSR